MMIQSDVLHRIRGIALAGVVVLVGCGSVESELKFPAGSLSNSISVYDLSKSNLPDGTYTIRGRINLGFERYALVDFEHENKYKNDFEKWKQDGHPIVTDLGLYCLSIMNKEELKTSLKSSSFRMYNGKKILATAYFKRNYRGIDEIAGGDCVFSTGGLSLEPGSIRILRSK